MKKIAVYIFIILASLSSVLAYAPTTDDVNILQAFYPKLNKFLVKHPDKILEISDKVEELKQKFLNNERDYYILTQIQDQIISFTNTWKQELYWPYKVLEAADGDNITIEIDWVSKDLRLLWVDYPEQQYSSYLYEQCYWPQTLSYYQNNLQWKDVYIEYDASQWKGDDKWRLMWYVFLSGENWNLQMIEKWYLREYTFSTTYKYQDVFKKAEKSSMQSKSWFWNNPICVDLININNMTWFFFTGELMTWSQSTDTEVLSWNNYTCWQKNSCGEMDSCEEAQYYLNTCGEKKLDNDGDWKPCETLCK